MQSKQTPMWTIPNLLTLLRFFLLFPTLWALWQHSAVVAIACGILAYLTDLLDGWLARKLQQESELGKMMDPLVDKLFTAAVVLLLYSQGRLPTWYLGIIVARDLLILFGGVLAKQWKGVVLQSLPIGKAAVTSVAVTLVLIVLEVSEVIINACYSLSTALLVFSFFSYLRRWLELFLPPKWRRFLGKRSKAT